MSFRRSVRRDYPPILAPQIALAVLWVAVFVPAIPVSRAAQPWQVITWGQNTAEWNARLGVTGLRLGCSDSPASCMKAAKQASQHGEAIFLAVPLSAETSGNGLQYSKLSQESPAVVEIGVDDFTNQYERLLAKSDTEAASVLNALIDGVKSGNSNLKFGATIYEDELVRPVLSDPKLPAASRARFDIVHLYLHFRSNGANVPEYLRRAKELFPNATVILGVYAYDRISYIPCAQGNSRPCTKQEEEKFFAQALDADVSLLTRGAAAGVEFYPGSFGLEDQWGGWSKPSICPGRREECIENTRALRRMVSDKFPKGIN